MRRIRRLHLPLVALLLAMAPLQASALSLGDLVVKSVPGEPLQALIPLTLESGESLAQLTVEPATAQEYARQNLQRPALLDGLRIALLARGENKARIQLFGEQPWQGEEAILLLQLSWPQGEMSRRFRLAPLQSAAERTPLYVEVAENGTLDSIAIRLSRNSNRSYMHMMVALYRANPDAFYRDNINNLKRGARLRVPSTEELYQLSDAEVFATLREHEAQQQVDEERLVQEEQAAQQLEQVKQENSEIAQRNRELRERLARLEQQVSSMSRQVLQRPAAPAEPADDAPPATAPAQPKPAEEKRPRGGEGLSAPLLLMMMLLVVAVVVGIWRFAPRLGRQE